MSETVLFGKGKDPELMVFNFWGQLHCRMGGKRQGPIEVFPKFWNLNPVAGDKREVLRIPAWKGSFVFAEKELETILQRDLLPVAVPEFPTVRGMTLGMNSLCREATKRIHRGLESLIRWIYSCSLLSHV